VRIFKLKKLNIPFIVQWMCSWTRRVLYRKTVCFGNSIWSFIINVHV